MFINIKKTPARILTGVHNKKSGNVLLSHEKLTLSSALSSFTSEFEMGSGGTYSLSSPDNLTFFTIEFLTSPLSCQHAFSWHPERPHLFGLASIVTVYLLSPLDFWVPAFAGMTAVVSNNLGVI